MSDFRYTPKQLGLSLADSTETAASVVTSPPRYQLHQHSNSVIIIRRHYRSSIHILFYKWKCTGEAKIKISSNESSLIIRMTAACTTNNHYSYACIHIFLLTKDR